MSAEVISFSMGSLNNVPLGTKGAPELKAAASGNRKFPYAGIKYSSDLWRFNRKYVDE